MRESARMALERLPCYDAAPDDLVAVVEDGSLARRHKRRESKVKRRVVLIHVDGRGKWDAAVPQDHVRFETRSRELAGHEADVAERVGRPNDLGTRAHDRRAPLRVEAQDIQALARRYSDPRPLADRQRANPRVRPDDGTVGPLDRPGDEGLGRAGAHELAVVAGREADVHAFGLRCRRETESRRDRSRLRLVSELADGKLDASQFALPEHVERVGLVLRRVARTEQMPSAVLASRGPRVVTGRESIPAELPHDVAQQSVELDVLVTRDARIRCLAARIRVDESVDDPLAEQIG